MIVQDGNELQQLANLENISGFYSDFDKLIGIAYDNKEAILAEKETPLYIFQKSILHEYTHYVFARLVQNTSKGISLYPTWFNEGICEYIANDQITVDYSGFHLAPLTELQTSSQWQNARFQENHEVYFQSYFVIKYLVDTYGSNILKEIIDETNTEEDFETGFLKATGITINNFEQDFLDIAI